MKSTVFSFLVIYFITTGQASIDWDNVKHADFNPIINGNPFFKPNSGNERIVGGKEVVPHSRPFQAALFIDWKNGQTVFCSGSLISTTVVLTAAHCVTSKSGVRSIEVILGAHNIRESEPTQVRITTTEFTVHPDWNQFLAENDIALIKLLEPVTLNENIALVSLPSRADVSNKFTGDKATVSGWGKDNDSANNISPILRSTTNPVISKSECSDAFPMFITFSHLCVSGKGGHSACNGDSGGPLTIQGEFREILVGIVSFGNGFGCSLGYPHVYTRITSFLDWIQDNAGITIK